MRNTTVPILLIFISVCAHAQDVSLASKIARLTRISIGENVLQHGDANARLIELNEGVSPSYLTNQGVEIYRRVSKNVFVVKQSSRLDNLLRQKVKQNIAVNYSWKLADDVSLLPGDYVVKLNNPSQMFHAGPGAKVVALNDGILRVAISLPGVLTNVLKNPNVVYVGKESFQAKEESRVLDLNLNPNHINQIHHLHPELNGSGITISMKERHYDIADIDLAGRHVPSALGSSETGTHATDMATIAAGAGNSFVTGKGVAREAFITSSTFDDLLPDTDQEFNSLNVKLQNHSYGTEVESFYGLLAEAYDQSANRIPTLLHVFSSGNQAGVAPGSGKYKDITGYANITGNSKMAKNALVVGASDTTGRASFFSSRGPAHDGRVKPDVVAYSTAGSSNSAALVSGIVGMLQQAYKMKTGDYPPSALIKAVLINGAADVQIPGVDFQTGFGNVDAFKSLRTLQQGNILTGEVEEGEVNEFTLSVPPGVRDLKVTLCWNDPAAVANASSALVNDLDMSISKDLVEWKPWVLNSDASVSALTQPATRGVDHINNVEQVTIDDLSPGDYQIRVRGTSILTQSQEFFIAYQWEPDQSFQWKYPTASDHFPYNGETGTYFYWESSLDPASGDLEYSIDGGNTWSEIKRDVDLGRGYFRWDLSSFPERSTAVATARMVTSAGTFPTDLFTISKVWFPEIGFNCGDSVLFQWPRISGVEAYELQTLTDGKMSLVQMTADSFMIVSKSEFPSPYFSVNPILPGGKKALRTPAVDYDLLGSCYVTMFTDEVVPAEGIYLNLRVGTTYGIAAVLFEREDERGTFHSFAEVTAQQNRDIRVLDAQPIQGLNRYRARFLMVNGSEIISPVLEVFFITKSPYIVFPNPVRSGSEIQVFSGESEDLAARFDLYKSDGSLTRSVTMSSDREFISLVNLHPGMYFYEITSLRGIFRGKIFIQ